MRRFHWVNKGKWMLSHTFLQPPDDDWRSPLSWFEDERLEFVNEEFYRRKTCNWVFLSYVAVERRVDLCQSYCGFFFGQHARCLRVLGCQLLTMSTPRRVCNMIYYKGKLQLKVTVIYMGSCYTSRDSSYQQHFLSSLKWSDSVRATLVKFKEFSLKFEKVVQEIMKFAKKSVCRDGL